MRVATFAATIVTIAFAISSPTAQQPTGASTLRLTAACRGQGPEATLHVEFQNSGTTATTIVPGFTPAGTQTHVVNSLKVAVIRIATGATEEYIYINPKFAAFSGRSEPWTVPLAPGARHEVDLLLTDFISGMTYALLDPIVANGGRLIFESKPAGPSAAKAWRGTVEAPIQDCG